MALLAEELVEEWLNRMGFFTIRGIRLGVQEIDLLAVKYEKNGPILRHVEVQASIRPISYISKVPKHVQKREGRAPNSVKRSETELQQGVQEWVEAKFRLPKKVELMERLHPGKWRQELVVNNVKSEPELDLIRGQGVAVTRLSHVIAELADSSDYTAAGSDFVDLVSMGLESRR